MTTLTDLLRTQLYGKKPENGVAAAVKPVLDSTKTEKEQAALDSAEGYELAAIAQQAVAAIHQWIETDDLDSGETMADRLMGLFVGIADSNKDGELDDDDDTDPPIPAAPLPGVNHARPYPFFTLCLSGRADADYAGAGNRHLYVCALQ